MDCLPNRDIVSERIREKDTEFNPLAFGEKSEDYFMKICKWKEEKEQYFLSVKNFKQIRHIQQF